MRIAVFKRIVWQAAAVLGVSALVALGSNALRSEGIPVVAQVPYDIFAPCKDSEVTVEAASIAQLSKDETLYVDARNPEAFAQEHVTGAINVPYSALFGAADGDIEKVKNVAAKKKTSAIFVYGMVEDPAAPGSKVDFAAPLAKQLVEAGLEKVSHIPGGLEALKKKKLETVKAEGDKP